MSDPKRTMAAVATGSRGVVLAFLLLLTITLTAVPGVAASRVTYAVSIHPLAAILQEVTAGRAALITLLPAGASPHTFTPRPSAVQRTEEALALMLVGGDLDPWADKLPARQRIQAIDLVPDSMRLVMTVRHGHGDGAADDHDEGVVDPHFWTDPLTVRAMLPALVEQLCTLDPGGCDVYRRNAATWSSELEMLDRKLASMLQPLRGVPLFLFHPSFQYLLHRYDLELAGLITPVPGREATPRALHDLVRNIRASGARFLFTEPQLPARSATVLAEAASSPGKRVEVLILDPLGGTDAKMTYRDLLFYNARMLSRAAP